MKLQKDTVELLKWMATINGGIKLEPGNKVYSKSESGLMCVYAEIEDVFEERFITSNLQKFLSVIALIDDPNYDITEECVYIHDDDNKNKLTFYQTNEALVTQSNKVPQPRDDIAVKFVLPSVIINKIMKSAAVLSVSDIKLEVKNGEIYISSLNRQTKSLEKCEFFVGTCSPDISETFYYKKNNLKLIQDYDYDVEVYSGGLSKFTAVNSPYKKLDIYVVTTIEGDE